MLFCMQRAALKVKSEDIDAVEASLPTAQPTLGQLSVISGSPEHESARVNDDHTQPSVDPGATLPHAAPCYTLAITALHSVRETALMV